MSEDQGAVAKALVDEANEAIRYADQYGDRDQWKYLRIAAIAGLAQTAALLAINDTLAQIRNEICRDPGSAGTNTITESARMRTSHTLEER